MYKNDNVKKKEAPGLFSPVCKNQFRAKLIGTVMPTFTGLPP